jgi:murein L,D-transpeptidase YafK
MKRIGILLTLAVVFLANTSFYHTSSSNSRGTYYIVIDKSDYELNVYDAAGWLITYPIVFGNDNQGDKLVEGDRKTPEGTFTIISKRVHEKWCRYMGLDYPTAEDVAKFNLRKQQGLIPPYAKIGGGIGIHGTWPHEDYAVDQYQNWTNGCISLKNEHVRQLFEMMPVGTKVTIKR